jgi:hypothetical protein
LTGSDPSLLAMNSSGAQTVVADFPGYGVWAFEGNGWTQVTPSDASSLAVAQDRTIVAEFPGAGVWVYSSIFTHPRQWRQITPNDAYALSMSENFADVVSAAFAQPSGPISTPGSWVNQLNGTGWEFLSSAEPSLLGTSARHSETVVELPGFGVWMFTYTYNSSGQQVWYWENLTPADVNVLAVDTGVVL